MSFSVDDIYKIMQFCVNKSQNGYLSPSQFNLVINQAQTSYQTYLLGEFQQYQNGRAQSRITYSQNENIRQRLTPLLTKTALTIDGSGNVNYPSDYVQTDTIYTSEFKRVRFVQQDSLFSYKNSTIDPIDTNPIYLLESTKFQFYPVSLGTATLFYIKNAPSIVWGYTLDGNGRPVYSLGTSVQPVWDDVDILEIISRALRIVGVNLKDGEVQQFANQIITQGQ